MDYSDTHGTLGGDAVTDVTAVVTMFGPWEGKQAYIFNVTCFVSLSATTPSFAQLHIFSVWPYYNAAEKDIRPHKYGWNKNESPIRKYLFVVSISSQQL